MQSNHKTIKDFIWKDLNGCGLNLVKWDTLARPRELGSLGILRARHMNIASLGKLVADLVTDIDAPWASILKSRYKCVSMQFPNRSEGCFHTYNAIRKASMHLLDGFEYRIGFGLCSFWYTPWLSKTPLASRVPYVHMTGTTLRG